MAFFNTPVRERYDALYSTFENGMDETARKREVTPDAPVIGWGAALEPVKGLAAGMNKASLLLNDAFATIERPILSGVDAVFGTDALKSYDEAAAREKQNIMSSLHSLRPDAQTSGYVGTVLNGVLDVGPQYVVGTVFGGPGGGAALAGSVQGYAGMQEGIAEGLTPLEAAGKGFIEGGFTAAGAYIPGHFASKKVISMLGGAGAMAAQGVGQRASLHAYLNAIDRPEMAQQYQAFDKEAVATDIVLGAAFGWLGGGKTKAVAKPLPSTVDAALVAKQSHHYEIDTAPGIPLTTEARQAHVAAMNTATAQLMTGQRVDVEAITRGQEFGEKPLPEGLDVQAMIRHEFDRAGAGELLRDVERLEGEAKARGLAVDEDGLTRLVHGLPDKPPEVARGIPDSAEIKRNQGGKETPDYHDLNAYGRILYRETSIDSIKDYAGIRSSDLGADSVYLANKPEMAIGQGKNKGVMLEFESAGLRGFVNTKKPGWEALWDTDRAGELVGRNRQSDYERSLRRITIKDAKSAEAAAFEGANRHHLESKGFIRHEDGESIVYTKAVESKPSETHAAVTDTLAAVGVDKDTARLVADHVAPMVDHVAGRAGGDKKVERFPRVDSIDRFPFGPTSIKPKTIAEGMPLYRETNGEGLYDLLYSERQFGFHKAYVTDNPDIAIGQGSNKGVMVRFRANSLSGAEHKKPMTGDLAGREYVTDVIAPRAIDRIEFSRSKDFDSLRGIVKRILKTEFVKKEMTDGKLLFERAPAETGAKLQSPEVENPSMTIPDETGQPVLASEATARAVADLVAPVVDHITGAKIAPEVIVRGIDETGRTVETKMRADEALKDNAERMERMKGLLECLG